MIKYNQTVNNLETPEIEMPKINGYKKQFSIELPQGAEEPIEEAPMEAPAEQPVEEAPVETPVETPVQVETPAVVEKPVVPITRGTITFSSGVKVGNMQEVLDKFAEAGISVRVTSGVRKPGQVGNAGNRSHHIKGNAIDIVPGKGETWESMRKKIKENEGLKNWLRSKKIGIIDETVAETMNKTGATGPHWHVGPDQWALRDFEAIFAKAGAKLPMMQSGGVFENFNFDNIYKNSTDKIKAVQRELGVKDDGLIGDKTIRALQRRVGTKDDGAWGNNSIAAAKQFKASLAPKMSASTSNLVSPSTENTETNSPWQNFKEAWNAGKQVVTKTASEKAWMPKTRSGKATATEVANERIGTLSNYITEDIGRDANYVLAQQEGREKRPLVLAPEIYEEAGKEFDQKWIAEGGDPQVMSNPDWNQLDFNYWKNRSMYGYNREDAMAHTPAELKINKVSAKAGSNPQEQLTEKERDEWAKEIGLNLTQLAELESQRQQAKTNYYNAATQENKDKYRDQVRTLSDRIAMSANAEAIRYDGESRTHDPIPSGYMNLVRDIEARHNQSQKAELTDDERNQLQFYYDKYGVSPQYSRMKSGEKFALDHLHAAGYSYNSDDNTIKGISQKATDAKSGLLTPRTLDGKENGTFPMTGYRRGVTMHTNQLGDNISYQFNKPDKVAQKTMFTISPSMAYDWGNGKFHVALSESGNYGTRKAASPLLNRNLMEKVNAIDYNNFESFSPEEKQKVYDLLESEKFNIREAPKKGDFLRNPGKTSYNDKAVVNILKQLQNAQNNVSRPGVISGNNSLYHVPMQQQNKYTSGVYGKVITGLQKIGGKYSTFTQDLYDFDMAGLKAFGPGTWYKTAQPLSERQIKELGLQ